MNGLIIAVSAFPVLVWLGLFRFRAGFWRADQRLDAEMAEPATWPAVVAVVPARNEAAVIGRSLTSLLRQDYPAAVSVIVVDDNSDDETAARAEQAGEASEDRARLTVVEAGALAPGWTGKLWALAEGLRVAGDVAPDAAFLLFSDADVEHDPANLRLLVAKALAERLDMVSLMVLLPCRSKWEELLIPAFVFFFQKLYPQRWVNDPRARCAAAAGGCMLVRRAALARAGGIEAIRGELIDDVALARVLKAHGPIWLGLTDGCRGLRRTRGLRDVWDMVARTAYHHLQYSPLRLTVAIAGMGLAYLIPPLAALGGSLTGEGRVALLGIAAWALMMRCYEPTLRLYRRPWLSGLDLPVAALLFMFMTIDSARRHRRGVGGAWKGRTYTGGTGTGGTGTGGTGSGWGR